MQPDEKGQSPEIKPLRLKKIEKDHFERIYEESGHAANTSGTFELKGKEKCSAEMMAYLEEQQKPISYTELEHAMIAQGSTKSTFGRALKDLKETGVIEFGGSGYKVAGPIE